MQPKLRFSPRCSLLRRSAQKAADLTGGRRRVQPGEDAAVRGIIAAFVPETGKPVEP